MNSNSKKLNVIQNAAKTISETAGGSTKSITSTIFIILISLLVIGSLGFLLYKYIILPQMRTTPTPANMETVLNEQKKKLKDQYTRIDRMKALVPLETNQNFLVNFHTLFEENAGFLGPKTAGIVEPNFGIPLSIANGVRGFVLNLEEINGKLVAIVRDSMNVKQSMNDMPAVDVITAIMENAFKDMIEGRANIMKDDPCILYLRFAKHPSEESMKILASILNRYSHLLLSTNEKGDFTYRNNEDKLFLLKPQDVARKVIILSNIETNNAVGNNGMSKSMKKGFYYYINGRVWKYIDKNVQAGEVRTIFEINYMNIKMLNDDGKEAMIRDSRLKYIIGYNNVFGVDPSVCKQYGIQGVAGNVFESTELKKMFETGGFAKTKELRYIVPDPIKISSAPKELNSNGGVITAPTI
jgi:hypothetical protein